MRITPASDSSLLVTLGDAVSFETHCRVISLFRALEQIHDRGIRNLHPAYVSLLIDFDPLSITHQDLEIIVSSLNPEARSTETMPTDIVEIPVCYEPELAPDLANVAQQLRLTEDTVVALHLAGEYRVYFLGFSPGFAYMGGLSERLHVSRLETPRTHVKGGSVGLAGAQTGIYPSDSPGGWQLIGRTPLKMFDASRSRESLLRPGDRVQFKRITAAEFERIAQNEERSND